MSGGQTKNAALTTALAFHYQVLIGLDKCFCLEEGQSVWFERR
jgi:ABC-type sulfate/molybdate transport systems ATPase subunit